MITFKDIKRSISTWKYRHHELDTIQQFVDKFSDKTGIYTLDMTLPFEFIYLHKGNNLPLVVWFHGAVDQSKTKIPHFVGVSLAAKANYNSVHIADPAINIDSSLRSCWYVGTSEMNVQSTLIEFLEKLRFAINAPRIVAFGSSGGGFPALYLASKMENVFSVVNSPCTTLLDHPNKDFIENFVTKCFDGQAMLSEDASRVFTHTKGYKVLGSNQIKYLMNTGDSYNIRHFAVPFFRQFGINFPNLEGDYAFPGGELIVRNWGDGHIYPPYPYLLDVILKASES